MPISKSQQVSQNTEYRVTAFEIQYDLGADDGATTDLPVELTFLINAKTLAHIQSNEDSLLADLITTATDMLVCGCCYRVEAES